MHSSLLHILSGHPIPKKERSLDDIAAYRIKQKPLLDLSAEEVKNPLSGKLEKSVDHMSQKWNENNFTEKRRGGNVCETVL